MKAKRGLIAWLRSYREWELTLGFEYNCLTLSIRLSCLPQAFQLESVIPWSLNSLALLHLIMSVISTRRSLVIHCKRRLLTWRFPSFPQMWLIVSSASPYSLINLLQSFIHSSTHSFIYSAVQITGHMTVTSTDIEPLVLKLMARED